MLTRSAAETYGKRIGCKYYVMNTRGGLMGGFKKKEDAEKFLLKCKEDFKNNPFSKGDNLKFFIKVKN